MISTQRFYSFLGLCRKAGKMGSGSELSEKMIKSGKAKLIIIAEDASSATKKRFKNKCEFYDIDHIIVGQKESLGRYLGRNVQSVIAITDVNFKKKLMELADSVAKEEKDNKDSDKIGGERENGKSENT